MARVIARSANGRPADFDSADGGSSPPLATIVAAPRIRGTIYIIGSLRNPRVPEVAHLVRTLGYDAFDDWYAAGPEADDMWQRYEMNRGRTYGEALKGLASRHIFAFDKYHLDRADAGILLLPAGKSAHLELGYLLGRGKSGWVFYEKEPERWDQLYQLSSGMCFGLDALKEALR